MLKALFSKTVLQAEINKTSDPPLTKSQTAFGDTQFHGPGEDTNFKNQDHPLVV